MPTQTIPFNGSELALDARPDRLDIRDRMYTPRVRNLPIAYPEPDFVKKQLANYIKSNMVLNQGKDGACTGFGLAAVINYLFWLRDSSSKESSPRMIYHLAQLYDEWAGEDYVGSSCRGALKGWHKHGVCSRELWPYTVDKNDKVPDFEAPKPGWEKDALSRALGVYYRIDKESITDMQAAIVEIGAIYVSCKVHRGWGEVSPAKTASLSKLDQLPIVNFSEIKAGGHAFALLGYTDQGFVVQNSWGRDWGLQGFAILTYDDWLVNGSDAWTVSLGVPVRQVDAVNRTRAAKLLAPQADIPPSAAFKASGSALIPNSASASSKAGQPALSMDQAYSLTVVMGNDGGLIQRLLEVANAAATVDKVLLQAPQEWFKQQGNTKVLKLALYAHGGLNSEDASLKRIAAMAPYFLANGIYPVFITWKTGLSETLGDILTDKLKDHLPAFVLSRGWLQQLKNATVDVMDRTVESMAASLGGKAQWMQMKQNAALAIEDGNPPRGLLAIADRLKDLNKALGKGKLEIHLIGHSAGSIVHGHLLNLLTTRKLTVSTCSLYAPACSLEFAENTYRPAMENDILARENFHIHLLSDARERDDHVAGIYRKSLLYLVARAFETRHKTPLLGMAASLDAAYFIGKKIRDGQWNEATIATLKSWNKFYWGKDLPSDFAENGAGLTADQKANLHIINDTHISNGKELIRVAHGTFDNDVAVISQTLARVLGMESADALPVTVENLEY
ncbi:MAG: C1 family peptidase [Undibacterium umbellatum]|uniref:C1 family peptidase n=1 Tax=Undibacterium umbellatum TaxID=2762300 RepID=UPI003BB68F1F